MAGYFKNISALGRLIYPSLLWNMPRTHKTIYLTFDDGPIPQVTPWVLSLLKKYDAKATFFCIGENIEKHPHLYQHILAEGHSTGNHTFNHLKGWLVSTEAYTKNTLLAEEVIRKNDNLQNKIQIINSENQCTNHKPSPKLNIKIAEDRIEKSYVQDKEPGEPIRNSLGQKLFRPPYGRITPKQINALKKLKYKIVMWDLISGDFDQEQSQEICYKNVVPAATNGSIVVFHDSEKASNNLRYVLPRFLKYYNKRGYKFKAL